MRIMPSGQTSGAVIEQAIQELEKDGWIVHARSHEGCVIASRHGHVRLFILEGDKLVERSPSCNQLHRS